MKLLKMLLSAKREPADNKVGIQDVIENLRLLSKGESDIAEFYQLCGDVFADERDFWHQLATSEQSHADMVLRMADLVEKEPRKYRPGRSFSVVLARLFRAHVHGLVEKMRKGEIQKKELVAIAADIENSVVELNYGDLVKTDVPEFIAMARTLDEETGEHREAFEKRMK
ncbi:MAG TPA: hypothetical protein VI298_05435 [Geobacteraceae bacterium]